jgi:hypothetical protein
LAGICGSEEKNIWELVDAAGGDISGVRQMEITAFATLSHHIAHLGH